MNLQEKVKKLPVSPGVYLMKDSLGGIIYVGKAKSLKKRVQSYFRNSKSHTPKIQKLVKHLKDFDYILTDTEFEAFLLECKLIKELKPPYNRKMKNPLSFAYIVIDMKEDFRSIKITNSPIKEDDHLSFGPYSKRNTLERAIQGIKECFKIDCSHSSIKGSACLNYSIGLCMGICLGGSSLDKYNAIIDKIAALLNGTDRSLLEEMKQMMVDASENFDFETAGKIRDSMDAIIPLIKKEEMIEFTEENKNIVVIEYLNDLSVKLFLIKRTEVLFSGKYLLEEMNMEQLIAKIKVYILTYFKAITKNSAQEVGRNEIDEAQIIYSYLKSNNCSFVIIPEKWLDDKNHDKIDVALNQLLEKECQVQ
jgi:excinuclease ABC subunit C